jgi:hypothetical protein
MGLRVQGFLLGARTELAAAAVVVVRGRVRTGGDQLVIVIVIVIVIVSHLDLGLVSRGLGPRTGGIPAYVLERVGTRLVTLALHSRLSLRSGPANATRKVPKHREALLIQSTLGRISHPSPKRLTGTEPDHSLDQDEKAVMAKKKSGRQGRIAPSSNRAERSCSFLLERGRAGGKSILQLSLPPGGVWERKKLVRNQRPRKRCISLRQSRLGDWRISSV